MSPIGVKQLYSRANRSFSKIFTNATFVYVSSSWKISNFKKILSVDSKNIVNKIFGSTFYVVALFWTQ